MSDVVALPDYSDANPYQSELAAGLERRGVDVEFGRDGVFPILRSVRDENYPDVLHLHWLTRYTLADSGIVTIAKVAAFVFELAVFKFLLGGTVVWTIHNLLEHEKRWPRIELAVKRLFVRVFCDRAIVHCEVAADAAQTQFGISEEKLDVIPHGHYIDAYENETSAVAAREQLGVETDSRVLLFFGGIRPYKGVPALIDAFGEVDSSKLELVIAGNPWNDDIERRIREACAENDRIHLELAFIDPVDVQVYFNAADAIVVPFRNVLTSGSVILGMSFRLAAIVPRIGCLPEMLPDDGAIFYDPAADDALVEAVETAAEGDLSAMGRNNFDRAESLDWDRIAAATERAYLNGKGVAAERSTAVSR